jgi:hypothetical protein
MVSHYSLSDVTIFNGTPPVGPERVFEDLSLANKHAALGFGWP